MHTKRYERIRAYKTDAEEKAKKANGFSEKQTKAKKADIRYTIYDKDLLPNGNKKESKKYRMYCSTRRCFVVEFIFLLT